MKPRNRLTLLALLSLPVFTLGAEPVVAFSYEGLRAVKAEVAEGIASRYIGEEADGDTEERLIAALRGTGLFSSVEVKWAETETDGGVGAVGAIELEERKTFVAVPMGGTDGGDFSLGAAVIETNLFGLGKRLAAAGKFGKDSWSFSLRYSDPFAFGGSGILAGNGYIASGTVKKSGADGELLSRFDSLNLNLGASTGLRAGESGVLRLGAGLLSHAVAANGNGDGVETPDSLAAPYVSFSAERSVPSWDGVFNSESSASAETGAYAGEEPALWFAADVTVQFPLRPGIRVAAAAKGRLLTRDSMLLDPGAREIQSFLMSSSYFAPRVAGVAAEAECRLLETPPGTVSAFAGGEAAVGAGGRGGDGRWFGPKGGIRLYFRKVPLPGAAFTAGYDLAGTGLRLACTLGVRF